jgi:hypothetical protein
VQRETLAIGEQFAVDSHGVALINFTIDQQLEGSLALLHTDGNVRPRVQDKRLSRS